MSIKYVFCLSIVRLLEIKEYFSVRQTFQTKMAFVSPSCNSFKSHGRSQFASVSMLALNYQATDRVKSLAKPKIRRETTIRDGERKKIIFN